MMTTTPMRTTSALQSSIVLTLLLWSGNAFVWNGVARAPHRQSIQRAAASAVDQDTADTAPVSALSADEQRAKQKQILLGLLDPKPTQDAVLADPVTKEPIVVVPKSVGTYFGSYAGRQQARQVQYELTTQSGSSGKTYRGSSNTFFNLLEPMVDEGTDSLSDSNVVVDKESDDDNSNNNEMRQRLLRNVTPLIPPPLRSALATAGVLVGDNYVPMRDLFTSPAVSYAYERGWRQNFRQAGFPGEDEEARMAMEYFAPSAARAEGKDGAVLVDMSCATGLFTRRFAQSDQYARVLGCDYSDSMLLEARRRIQADAGLRTKNGLDLVRLDVGQIPMQDESVDALHAGAAMHCWPELDKAVSEIYRVLKPGGRYFATTFLSDWFRLLHVSEGGATGPSRQAFQYFESVDKLRKLLVNDGGFENEKVNVEILAPSCVVIRCEK